MRPNFLLVLCFLISAFNISASNTSFESVLLNEEDTLSTLVFDMESCFSSSGTPGSAVDYSEFTANVDHSSNCAEISLAGLNLYRDDVPSNMHSCSPGVNGSTAMCVSISEGCDYISGDEKAVKFDVLVTPLDGEPATLSELRFFESSPETFQWLNGPSGPNDYPTQYAIRVLVNGSIVYEESGLQTETEWNEEVFNFTTISAFTVNSATEFNFELVPYCPVGNGASVKAWDLDNIQVSAGCIPVDGGVLILQDGSTEVEICSGDGLSDEFSPILSGALGDLSQWVITTDDLEILELPTAPPFDFEGANAGTCLIWNINYLGTVIGLEIGANAENLEGCFDLSNPITIIRNSVNGGIIELETGGTTLEICAGDGISDSFNVVLEEEEGDNTNWIITDSEGNILALPDSQPFDLEGAGEGTCFVWNISYTDGLMGLEIDNNASDLTGCYSLSNPIEVIRTSVAGGLLSLLDGSTETELCINRDNYDLLDVMLIDQAGMSLNWVITDIDGKILDLPTSAPFDFSGTNSGTCLIWNLAHDGFINGLEVDSLVENLTGCYALSNAITVDRNVIDGGSLTLLDGGSDIEICVGDGENDVFDIKLENNEGENFKWVITNTSGGIISLPDSPPFDLEGAGEGVCLLWNLSCSDMISGLEIENNIADLEGCFDLSDSIRVNRTVSTGGTLAFSDGETEIELCVGDGISNPLGVSLENEEGENFTWLITDVDGNILDLPIAPPFDLEGAGVGTCLIWHLAHGDETSGIAVDSNANDIVGCTSLSNPLTVVRTEVHGGILSTSEGETNFIICADDGESDEFTVVLENEIGTNSAWIITDNTGNILEIPSDPIFDLEGAGGGVCLIWHLSYEDGLGGLEVGSNANGLIGCADLSNPITVTRLTGAACNILCDIEGGNIMLPDSSTSVTLCADDGMEDLLSPLLMNSNGAINQWVVTDADANILALPTSLPINLEGAGAGTCLIWNLSYDELPLNLSIDSSVLALDGCFDLSNSITVTRVTGDACDEINCDVDGGAIVLEEGGTEITICVGDGIPDLLDVNLASNTGMNSQWMITNVSGTILGLETSSPFDLEGTEAGICVIWHLSYDNIMGLALDSNTNDFSGCFDLSNPILVTKVSGMDCDNIDCEVNGGMITTTEGLTDLEICSDDGISDEFDVELQNNSGLNSAWLITDASLNIIALPSNPPFDLEGGEAGTCLVWHISYDDITGLEIDSNALDLGGCYDLSNPITVVRYVGDDCLLIDCEAEGGFINYTDSIAQFVACVGDGIDDFVDVELEGILGDSSQWLITNSFGEILSLPTNPPFNFEGAGGGICLIYHLSYSEGLLGLSVENTLDSLSGCFSLSNSLVVVRNEVKGGNLNFVDGSTMVEICVGDGLSDSLDVVLANAIGDSIQWIITDNLGNILALPDSFPVDFEGNNVGSCFIWNLSFNGEMMNLTVGSVLGDLDGCFSISNSIEVLRVAGTDCDGGIIDDGEKEIEFTVGPNPSSGILEVSLTKLPAETALVTVLNGMGQIIVEKTGEDQEVIGIDISREVEGVYYMWVESDGKREIKKIVKIK